MSQSKPPSLKEALERVQDEVRNCPQWLKEIYARNIRLEIYARNRSGRRSPSERNG